LKYFNQKILIFNYNIDTNYRVIKLMSHIIKLWRVIEHRLRKLIIILKNQFGFVPRRSTMETIFFIKQLMERYQQQKNVPTYDIY
jgi:hypothetical protein